MMRHATTAPCPARRWPAVLAVAALLLGGAAARAAEKKLKLAALDMKMETQMPEGQVRLLNELMLSELQSSGSLEVFGSSDMVSMLTLEEQRAKLTGCVDDSCLAEIGGALGVDLLLASSVGGMGKRYLFNIKVISVSLAKVMARETVMVERDEEKLIAAVQLAVKKVVRQTLGLPEEPAPAEPPASAEAPPVPEAPAAVEDAPPADGGTSGLAIGAWTSAGLAVAAGVVGGVLGGLALADQKTLDDTHESDPDRDDLEKAADGKALGADLLFGVAGAAAVAAIVLFVLDARAGDAPEVSAGPLPGGAGVMLQASF